MPRAKRKKFVSGIENEIAQLEHMEEHIVHKELHKLHKLWGLTRKDFNEIFTAEIISVTGGVVAGVALAFLVNRLELVPALFIALPGFLEMRGSIGGSLSARLSSALFLGYLRPRVSNQRILRGNVIASFVLATLVGLALGFVAYALELLLFGIAFPQIVLIMLLAGILSNVIEIPLTVVTTFTFFRRGVDPSNVMGPYVTTIGDIVSVVSIFAALVIVL